MASTEHVSVPIQWGLHWKEDKEEIKEIVWEV